MVYFAKIATVHISLLLASDYRVLLSLTIPLVKALACADINNYYFSNSQQ